MRPGQGSHRQKIAELRERGIREEDAHELRIPPRSAVVWRTQTWHCVGPNISQRDRLIMHVGCTLQLAHLGAEVPYNVNNVKNVENARF